MSLKVEKNIKKYELIYKKGQNHFYPNLDLVRIQKTLLKSNIGKTLDYGFGSGENLVFLSNEGHEIYGLETSITALKITKKKIKNKKLKSNLKILSSSKKLEFQDDFFDNIICLSVFSQLKNKDNAIHLLKEFNRKLKKDGILVIDINGPKSEYFYKKKDFFSLKNKKEFLDMLKKNNFKIINHGEVYKSYLNIKDHEFLAIAKKNKNL
jgi:ubiquinone/menaquinone biosynthesis C-methylase UbiE